MTSIVPPEPSASITAAELQDMREGVQSALTTLTSIGQRLTDALGTVAPAPGPTAEENVAINVGPVSDEQMPDVAYGVATAGYGTPGLQLQLQELSGPDDVQARIIRSNETNANQVLFSATGLVSRRAGYVAIIAHVLTAFPAVTLADHMPPEPLPPEEG